MAGADLADDRAGSGDSCADGGSERSRCPSEPRGSGSCGSESDGLPGPLEEGFTGITRADVAKFHHDLRHIPYQANRCLEVVSKMFSLAEMWGLRPDGTNPRKHIRKYPEEKRERFLSAAELRRIGEVLREMEAEGMRLPSAILAARLLILTGCRLNEIMTLKWSYVDLAERVLRQLSIRTWR